MKTKTIVLVGLVLSFCSARAANYYVNDGSTNADVFCLAPGATTNTGLTPSNPKSSLSDVLAAYTLGPGDTVSLDTGNYTNGPSIVIGPPHGGSAALGLVQIKGAGSTKTLLLNTNLGAYGLQVSGAGYLRVEGVAFRGMAQGVRVENSSHVELAGCEVAYCGYGVVFSGGSDHRVENCAIHHNGHQAVLASYSSSIVINGNAIYAQTGSPVDNHGIDLSYNCNSAQITGNTITNNSGRGITIYSCSTPLLQGNLISGNSAEAIYLQSCGSASLQDQTVWLNANGIRAYYCPSLTLGGSRIYSNTGYGVSVEGGAVSAVNNLIYANGGQGFTLLNSPQSTIANNTFYRNATVSLRLAGTHNNVRVANNILLSAGAGQTCIQFDTIGTSWFADYNDYFITNGAVLWNWKGPRYSLSALQTYSSLERHSIDRDPLFVDPDGADNVLGGAGGADDNFHLTPNSPALDAGDPTSDYAAEPAPNGSRINLGHLGGTAQADTSGNQRILRLLSPNGGEIAFRRTWVRWAATGPWSTNDLVKIEYSANNGGSWITAANAAALNNANGFYGWDLSAITPGTAYLMRVSSVDQPTITDSSDAAFEIQSPAAKVIYINDGSTANDTWCSAIGATTNTGLSAVSPLDSFQSVIEHYPAIGAGDELRVDTGVFDVGRTVYLNQQSSGAAGAPLVIRGSTSGAAIFSRADQSEDTFLFDGVSYVWFERLRFTLGVAGLRVTGTGLNPSVGITMKDCQTYSNSSVGIIVSTCSNLLVQGCSSWRNGGDGFSLPASNATVTNNVALWNGGNGLAISGWGSVDGNVAGSNGAWGINVSGFFQVRTNTLFRNYYGLFVGSSTTSALTVSDNVCRDNSDVGLQVNGYGSSYLLDAVNNRSYGNGNDGLRVNGGALARRNVVFNNGRHGILGGGGGETLRNNLIYSNAQWNVYVDGTGCATVFENNTLYGGNGLSLGYCCFGAKWFTNQNNIIRVMGSGKAALEVRTWPAEGFVSDYNDYYVTDGAVVANWQGSRPTLSAWQQITALDPNSQAIDPRFVDLSTNFHLRSASGSYRGAPFTAPGGGSFVNDADVSFCIDAGNPASGYTLESAPNGGRIDQGAFGNTTDASRSPATRFSLLVEPQPGATWFGTRTITWLTRGPWVGGDMVKLEFSADGGVSWSNIAASVAYALGRYDWNTTGLPSGTNYLVRISKTDGAAMNVLAAAFEVSASGPRTYYVNDTNTLNDVFCTAAATAANDGLSAATPKDSIQAILDTYNVMGGDTIKVDTGNYLLSATIVMTTNDMGTAGNPIVIMGSTNGTTINRQNASYNAFYLQGSEYVRFQNLKFTGGSSGLAGDGASSKYLRNLEILNCELMTNTYGLNFNYVSNLTVQGSAIHHNSTRGASLGGIAQATIVSNVFSYNSEGLYVDSSGLVRGNLCYSNSSEGLRVSGTFTVSDNTSWRNSLGIRGWTSLTVTNNLVFSNNYEGIYLNGGSPHIADGNRVYGNGATGIFLEGDGVVRRNVVYSNRGHGISVEGWSGSYREVVNNLCYLNGDAVGEFNIFFGANYWQGKKGLIANNTVYGGGGIYIGDATAVTNRHNIIWATGTNNIALVRYADSTYLGGIVDSDYNCLYATGGAIVGQWLGNQPELADWQFATKLDSHSFFADPQFVNAAGADGVLGGNNGSDDNFHLASTAGSYAGAPFTATTSSTFTPNATTSLAIDAATPSSPLGDEIAPNGSRRDLGAFGGTFDASLSPGTPGVSILNLAANANLRGLKTLYWITRGPWASGETLRLEYSTNGGASWFTAPGLNAVPYNQVSLDWDTSSLPPGSTYTARLVGNGNGAANAVSSVSIIANGPANFYVNDANPTNDVYCSAVGNESNSGLAPSTPKATLKRMFCDYKLIPGDRVWIDTGWWTLDSTVQFLDSGSVAARIRFIGSTNAAGSWFDRVDNQQNAFLLSSVDNLSLENLKITRSFDAIHIEGKASHYDDSVQLLGCELATNYNSGVYFNYATNLLVAGCNVRDNLYYGIYGVGYGIIRSNQLWKTTYYDGARVWGGPLLVEGNTAFQNGAQGIRAITLVTCRGNTVFSNNADGLYVEGGADNLCEAIENRVFLNGLGTYGGSGIYAQSGANAKRNVVYSNKGHGILVEGYEGNFRVIANNLAYNNGDAADEYNIYFTPNYWQAKQGLIENNTVYGGNGIFIGNPINVTNRNNIIWATGAGRYALCRYTHMDRYPNGFMESDYNNLLATDGATLGAWLGNQNDLLEWRKATGYDAHSFSVDPLFVNAAGLDGVIGGTNGLDDNFHLASTIGSFKGLPFTALTTAGFTADASHSPCTDAASPTSSVGAELTPNGGRADLGAFGATADASLSTGTRAVELGLIAGGSILRGTVPVYWWTHGAWQSNDTVLLEYSSNGGGSWNTIPGAAALPFANGVFAWDTGSLTPGANFKVRVAPTAGGASSVSGLLRILSNAATVFYLNDSSTTNDVYCTAVGSDANDGLSPSAPMANLKRLTATYKLMPGDTVRIDTGLWTLDANLVLVNSGAPAQLIRLVGSTNGLGSIFNRNDTANDAFYLKTNSYVRLENLKVTGARYGIYVEGATASFCQGIEIAGCEVYANNSWGIVGAYCSNIVISACISRNNQNGLDVDGGGSGTISGNSVHDNSSLGIYLNGSFLADGNDCFKNSVGLNGLAGVHAYNNLIHENTGDGALRIDGGTSEAAANRVYMNSGDGMNVSSSATARRNVVYSNRGHGMWVTGTGNTIRNNLVYDNDRENAGHWNIAIGNNGNTVENNTLYGGYGLYCWGPWGSINRNNIIWTKGAGRYAIYHERTDGTPVSDYNNICAGDGATLGYWGGTTCATLAVWKSTTGLDTNSLSTDPLFVDANGADDVLGAFNGLDDDFHLSSSTGSWHNGFWLADATNSPSIDAGDPSFVFTNEPYYNGLRVNQGVYGNTTEASKTAASGPFYSFQAFANPTNCGAVSVWPPGVSNLYYPANASVTLTATPLPHFYFSNWSGAISSTNRVVAKVVTANAVANANFAPFVFNTNGCPNWWLAQYGISTNQAGASADTDSDGFENWKEYRAGTSPTNAQSYLGIQKLTVAGAGRPALTFQSVAGIQYQVWGSTNLVNWSSVPAATTIAGSLQTNYVTGVDGPFTFFLEPPQGVRLFYRLAVP
jgi:parallel beta-helix repeat protein